MTTRINLVALNNVVTIYGREAVTRTRWDGDDWVWEAHMPNATDFRKEWATEFRGKLSDCADLEHMYRNPPPPPF